MTWPAGRGPRLRRPRDSAPKASTSLSLSLSFSLFLYFSPFPGIPAKEKRAAADQETLYRGNLPFPQAVRSSLRRPTMVLSALVVLAVAASQVGGHVSMQEPPARNVMWRMGYHHLPEHANDDYLICQEEAGALCRPCGDSAKTPVGSRHEAGGPWATGIITRTYTLGQKVDVHVNVTRSHGGSVEFKLCPHNDIYRPVQQHCLDQYPLEVVGHRKGKVELTAPYDATEQLHLQVQLPVDVTCKQCVLQMTNTAAQFKPKKVMFRNCADIAIEGNAKTYGVGGPPGAFNPGPQEEYFPEQQQHRFNPRFL